MKPNDGMSQIDSRSYVGGLCCHVKTGTVFYGIFVALGDICLMTLLVIAAIHPDVLKPYNQDSYGGAVFVQTTNASRFSNFDYDLYGHHISRDNFTLMFGVTLVCFISAVALIYGAAKNVASYMMPFFCMQVFDFCLSCLVVLGLFTYAPNVKHWIHDQGLENYPGMTYLMSLDSDLLVVILVGALILVLSVKAYFICLVWSCYKYIQLYVAAHEAFRGGSVDPDTEMLLPPSYEDAIKVSDDFHGPPAYSRE